MMPETETSRDDAAEEWSTPVYWEEDLAIKENRVEMIYCKSSNFNHDLNQQIKTIKFYFK